MMNHVDGSIVNSKKKNWTTMGPFTNSNNQQPAKIDLRTSQHFVKYPSLRCTIKQC